MSSSAICAEEDNFSEDFDFTDNLYPFLRAGSERQEMPNNKISEIKDIYLFMPIEIKGKLECVAVSADIYEASLSAILPPDCRKRYAKNAKI